MSKVYEKYPSLSPRTYISTDSLFYLTNCQKTCATQCNFYKINQCGYKWHTQYDGKNAKIYQLHINIYSILSLPIQINIIYQYVLSSKIKYSCDGNTPECAEVAF